MIKKEDTKNKIKIIDIEIEKLKTEIQNTYKSTELLLITIIGGLLVVGINIINVWWFYIPIMILIMIEIIIILVTLFEEKKLKKKYENKINLIKNEPKTTTRH